MDATNGKFTGPISPDLDPINTSARPKEDFPVNKSFSQLQQEWDRHRPATPADHKP